MAEQDGGANTSRLLIRGRVRRLTLRVRAWPSFLKNVLGSRTSYTLHEKVVDLIDVSQYAFGEVHNINVAEAVEVGS